MTSEHDTVESGYPEAEPLRLYLATGQTSGGQKPIEKVDHRWIQYLELNLGRDQGSVWLHAGPPIRLDGREVDEDSLIDMSSLLSPRICSIAHILDAKKEPSDVPEPLHTRGIHRCSHLKLHGSFHESVWIRESLGLVQRQDARWPGLSILLHLGNRHDTRSLDSGYADLFITPSRLDWDSSEIENDQGVIDLINRRKRLLEEVVNDIVRYAMDDAHVEIKFDDAIWETECVPGSGGDAYVLKGLVCETPGGTERRRAQRLKDAANTMCADAGIV